MKRKYKAALLVMGAAAWAGCALAVPTISLNDGTGNSIAFDGSVVSSSGSISGGGFLIGDTVTWMGSVGNWMLSVSTGNTLSGGSAPSIDLALSQASPGAAAGSLTVMFSDGGFGPSTGWADLTTSGGGNHGGSVVSTAYYGSSLFGMDNALADGSTLSGNGYYLTIKDVITAGTPWQNSVNGFNTLLVVDDPPAGNGPSSVPDGGTTVGMLGLVLAACGLLLRRIKLA